MIEHVFYYDETEHSRKINYQTVSASNYYDNFITVIVGWDKEKELLFKEKYDIFESKYSNRKTAKGELKSTTLQQNKFQYGLASQDKYNIQFIQDFLSIFDENTHVYFSVMSKIEYIVYQLFSEYENNLFIDADAMKYTITKTLNVYRPLEVIDCLCNSPELFVDELILFFQKCIKHNQSNLQLKSQENQAFKEIISYLERVNIVPTTEWNYYMPFKGFQKYLKEEGIKNYHLTLDKEGTSDSASKTILAAIESGIKNVSEADSTEVFGLRIADILAGIISKLMKALRNSLHYSSFDESIKKKILNSKWFDLNDLKLETYKQLYKIICKWDHAWYKSYAGNYTDDLIIFVALLRYMNSFDNAEIIRANKLMQGEYFNGYVCNQLKQYFERSKNKLPLEPVNKAEDDFFYNHSGAKVFRDIERQPRLKIDNSVTVEVLSVGINNSGQPLVTIMESGTPVCYQLPFDLSKWALTLIELANIGENLFPAKVMFSIMNHRFFADIL